MPLLRLQAPVCHILSETRDSRKRLGRHIEHDRRSRSHAHEPDLAAQPLINKEWTDYGPVLDQGDLGSCTGNATCDVLNCEPFADGTRPLLTETDAIRLYSNATLLDNIPGSYPPTDTGSSGLAVCKAAKKEGLIAGYKHALNLNAALHWLSYRGPVLVGTEWFTEMDTPDAEGYIIPSGDVRGGHEYALIAIDVDNQRVKMKNSWGDEWGQGGYAWICFDDLATLLARQGDATMPFRAP